MVLVDQWKKITHSNIVSLREVFTTKAFGDSCKLIRRKKDYYISIPLGTIAVILKRVKMY